jgi:hypothetical protein
VQTARNLTVAISFFDVLSVINQRR